MEFPVDVLEATSHGELERSARTYMNELLYADPDHAHYFTLPSGKKVQISLSSVGFVPLYGANLLHKVLALFTPQDQLTAVALFLANQWYCVEDILKTANCRREGLIKVRSVGERIVLYMLNRIVYRTIEMESGEMPFLCHSENDYAKIFWKNGQAVGFYSVKPKGSVCNNSLRQCYFLPVLDSIFVRKAHRGKGFGLQMLEDFVDSFNEDELGLRYPLSPAMTSVCRHYLDRYPADVDLIWEVEGVGGPYQRTKVAYKLSSRPLSDTHKGGHGEDNGRNGDIVEDEVEESKEPCLNITEEVIVVNKHHKVTEESDTPISTRTRSSEHRWRKRVRDEDGTKEVDTRPDKINRMEMEEVERKEFTLLTRATHQSPHALEQRAQVEEESQRRRWDKRGGYPARQNQQLTEASSSWFRGVTKVSSANKDNVVVVAPAAEEEEDEAPTAVEEQEEVPPAKEKQYVDVEELDVAPSVEEDSETKVDFLAEETSSSSLATDPEEEQGQDEEAMDILNNMEEIADVSEQSSKEDESQPCGEKENNTLAVEDKEEAQIEEEMDEEEEEKNAPDFSAVHQASRTKAALPTSKRTSKRLSKMTVEDDEDEQGESNVIEEDKGMSSEEEKVTTEEEAEHSSEEEEQVQDPPVIDKRVLRGKTKVIQTTQRTRSKRRGKI
ncbi:soluble lamin-associated protein of 75 kDa [Silurus meridionalis]|uniref:soluble lamin-associated protein of 75 kDa n=1 Tax=Silurus meridionalis TaxID=175797 RepID=UPI001EEB4DD7|nr:soluble lamin-associated protein of 75 kDa [Silurus meridionalis]